MKTAKILEPEMTGFDSQLGLYSTVMLNNLGKHAVSQLPHLSDKDKRLPILFCRVVV